MPAVTSAAQRRARAHALPRLSWHTRMRLWWHGADVAARCAGAVPRSSHRSMFGMPTTVKLVLLVGGFAYSVATTHAQSSRSYEVLDNIEYNRRRYYKKDFAPTTLPSYISTSAQDLRVVVHENDVNGLLTDDDNRIFSLDTHEEQQRRLASAVVTDQMLRDAKALLSSARYQRS